MPVEKFSEDDDPRRSSTGAAPDDAGLSNTRGARPARNRLTTPVGVGIALGCLVLAYFLLIGPGERPRTGSSGGDGTLVRLEPQTINLAEPGTSLEVRMVLEASSPEFAQLLCRRTAQLADVALTLVSTKKVAELDCEVGRSRLKRELADAISQRFRSDDARITNVYFTQFYYRLR